MRRRRFLSLLGSGLLVGCGSALSQGDGSIPTEEDASVRDDASESRGDGGAGGSGAPITPNVLVVMCDQLRTPIWFPSGMDALLPSMAALRAKSVSFGQHYTVSMECSSARASLVTGLYERQHFLGKNVATDEGNGPSLDPRFPTWGTLLDRLNLGYERRWFGKWHLSPIDMTNAAATWAAYGFSPGLSYEVRVGNSTPQGDVGTVAAFTAWLAARTPGTPWCTTVSLVNPHDIAHTYEEPGVPAELNPAMLVSALPQNYESSAQLAAKPRLQTFFQQAMDTNDPLPHGDPTDPTVQSAWLKLLDLYIKYQRDVDLLVGQVLTALESSIYASNTIVLFTADHGEHGGSHGLRNKHGTAYDETLRVPFYVYDPTGYWTSDLATERTQMTSSVDVVPLMMTMVSGGTQWQQLAGFEHLAKRPDLTGILRSSSASNVRSYILHSTDAIGPQMATLNGTAVANHITAIRTSEGKLVFYDKWQATSATVDPSGPSEIECYDYSTANGILETANLGGSSGAAIYGKLEQLYMEQGAGELTEAFDDPALQSAQAAALAAYLKSTFSS